MGWEHIAERTAESVTQGTQIWGGFCSFPPSGAACSNGGANVIPPRELLASHSPRLKSSCILPSKPFLIPSCVQSFKRQISFVKCSFTCWSSTLWTAGYWPILCVCLTFYGWPLFLHDKYTFENIDLLLPTLKGLRKLTSAHCVWFEFFRLTNRPLERLWAATCAPWGPFQGIMAAMVAVLWQVPERGAF